MNFKFLFVLIFFTYISYTFVSAQVAINSTGNPPDGSAMLDINASDRGLLIPRISLTGTNDNTTISSPTIGLLIYNTNTVSDVTPGFYFYSGSEWAPLGEDAYTFENGLNENGAHAVGLGGNLSDNTTINLSLFDINWNINNSGQFIIQNSGTDNIIFQSDGNADFKNNISAGEYYNFESIFGSTGYGFRTRSGNLEYKNSGGNWAGFPSGVPAGGTPYWWYQPSGEAFIQPQNNGNIRVYDSGENFGLYYDGATNQYGGYFRTTGTFTQTAAVVGFSDVSGNQTKGYLGYDGTWNSANNDFSIDGMAVFGEVEDKGRASIFGTTTRDASYASIIGYSDVWIAGYFSTLDNDPLYKSHPALYGQLIVKTDKDKNQAAIEGWSEYYAAGTGNRGTTVGGEFTAIGREQNSKGIDVQAKSWSTLTTATGGYFEVDSAETGVGLDVIVDSCEYSYGLYIEAGTQGISTDVYGIFANARTNDGNAIVGTGANALNLFTSGNGDGIVGVSDNGYGVFGQFDDNTGNLNNYGILGYDNLTSNFFYHNERSLSDGQSAGYFYRTRNSQNNGTDYWHNETNQAVEGYNYYGDSYSFGVSGFSWDDNYGRTGGVLGALYVSSGSYAWSSLGYENSSGTSYGLYYDNTYGSGTGGGKNQEHTGVGFGGCGDFMGGWIRGNIYGATVKGERYSLYVDGQTFTNNEIIFLSETNKNKRIATYVPTSDKPKLYLSGVAVLKNGKANVKFDDKYKNIIDKSEPVIVTVTPIGESKGIHLIQAKSTGFSVAENSNGKSNIKFNWIAIAQKKNSDNIKTPKELLTNNFDKYLDGFMLNESNSEKTAQPLWWNGQLQTSKINKIQNEKTKNINKNIKINKKQKIKNNISTKKQIQIN